MGYKRWVFSAVVLSALAAAAPAVAVSIPGSGSSLLAPSFVGHASTAAPISAPTVPQNPYLAPNPGSNMHNDAYGSNAYPGPGPIGRNTKVSSVALGVEECATVAFDSAGRLVALCGELSGPDLRLMDPATLATKAIYRLPNRDLTDGSSPLSDLCGGAYFYLDNQNRAVVATTNGQIRVIADTGTSLVLQHTYDLSSYLPGKDCLIALMPDWSGHIWFVTHDGGVGTLNPATGAVHVVRLPGEEITNSFSVDETGGAFIVTNYALYRFDADASGAPVITWRQVYDRGSEQKPGQLEQGSGTTPTLFGNGYVAITDNADPQMHVVVYNRSAASGGSEVCQQGVFAPGMSDTENALAAAGNTLIAENNYGYSGPQTTLAGKTTAPGVAAVTVSAGGQCSLAWSSQVVAPTSVPKVSLASGLVYVYSKPASKIGVDSWYLTAIDARTGATVYSRLAGVGVQFNNHYAAIYLHGGAAYIATLTGMLRFADSP
jgi:hypothetical protein